MDVGLTYEYGDFMKNIDTPTETNLQNNNDYNDYNYFIVKDTLS